MHAATARSVLAPVEAREALAGGGTLVVDLSAADAFERAHLPGARNLAYSAIVAARDPVGGLLPTADALSDVLSGLGLARGQPVLAYDDQGNGRASRLVWTLRVLGHDRCAILDGGLDAWREIGAPIEHGPDAATQPTGARWALSGSEHVADKDWILGRLGNPDVVLLDVRSPAEYRGDDVRSARGGHIPGALSFDWVRAMDPDRHRALRPAATLRLELAGLGATPEREVVCYCQTHHRSSHTWVVLRHLGFSRVRGYPGSWSDWGNDPELPIRRGDAP